MTLNFQGRGVKWLAGDTQGVRREKGRNSLGRSKSRIGAVGSDLFSQQIFRKCLVSTLFCQTLLGIGDSGDPINKVPTLGEGS